MIQVVPRLLQVAATRAILLRLFLFLIVVRCAVLLPLRADLPDLSPTFHANPFLALLDIFSGGALARGSAFALGVYPFLVGRLAARLLVPRHPWAVDLIKFQKRSYRFTLVAAVAMASAYPFFFNRFAGSQHIPFDPFVVLTLTTGSLLTLGLGTLLYDDDYFPDQRWGLQLLLAIHVLATLPEYLLWTSPSMTDRWVRLAAAAVIASLYLWMSALERRFPIAAPRSTTQRKVRHQVYLPFSLSSSRVAPLLWLLAAFGAIQFLSAYLLRSEVDWVRGLAAAEQRLTDLSSPASWCLFFGLGFLLKTAYALAVMSPFAAADRLKKEGSFIPGVRPGRATGWYFFRALTCTVWIEPLVTMGSLLMVAWLGAGSPSPFQLRNRGVPAAGGVWPILLVSLLYATHPLSGLPLMFKSLLVRESYSGFIQRDRS